MKSKKNTFISIIIVISIISSFLIYQAVKFTKKTLQTQYAMKETVSETVNTKCFILRDEEYIRNSTSGTVVSVVDDGSRVAAGETVSMVFDSETEADKYLKKNELEADIRHYNELAGQANTQAFDISSLTVKMNAEFYEYLNAADKRDFVKAIDYSEQFRDTSTTKQISTGTAMDVSEKLNALNTELTELNAENLSYKEIKSEKSGYFINGADGYENTLSYEDIDTLDPKNIRDALESKPASVPEDVSGRIISSFDWYILCVINTKDFTEVSYSDKIYVNFPEFGVEKLPVSIYKMGEKNSDEMLLILSCNLMNDSLTDIRITDVEIITNQYTGYKIMNSALRTVENDVGVYVVSGNLIKFKKVHIVYECADYTIVDNPKNYSSYIRIYDKVVIKGVELYDNKLI